MEDFIVCPMRSTDVDAVVSIHLAAFEGFFLTFLGPSFLSELYGAITSDPSGFGHVCRQNGQLCGFVVGTDQPSGFYSRLLRQRWWRFGLASTMPALRHPSVIPRLLRAFRVPHEAPSESGIGMLMSISVAPDLQRQGAGKALVQAFLEEATRRNLNQIGLSTDKINNEGANCFYQRLGFTCVGCFVTPEGRHMNEYVIDLSDWSRPLETS